MLTVALLAVAEMRALAPLPAVVVMVKEALVWPAGTVTLEGTVADGLLLERFMVAGLATAAVIVTVAAELLPATTVEGESVRAEGVACEAVP